MSDFNEKLANNVFFAMLFWIACVLDVVGVIETQYEYLKFMEIAVAIILVVLADIQDKLDKLNIIINMI